MKPLTSDEAYYAVGAIIEQQKFWWKWGRDYGPGSRDPAPKDAIKAYHDILDKLKGAKAKLMQAYNEAIDREIQAKMKGGRKR